MTTWILKIHVLHLDSQPVLRAQIMEKCNPKGRQPSSHSLTTALEEHGLAPEGVENREPGSAKLSVVVFGYHWNSGFTSLHTLFGRLIPLPVTSVGGALLAFLLYYAHFQGRGYSCG